MSSIEKNASIASEECSYKHPRPEVAVDVVMCGYLPSDRSLRLLLHYREAEKKWAFPGHIVRCSPKRDKNDKEYPGEYGPEAETIPQAFRESLQFDAKLFSRTSNNESKNLNMSQHYVPRHNRFIPEDPIEFQKDECLAQLPVRSKIRRDEDRLKEGEPVYKRVISLPILTMMSSRVDVWDDVNKYRDIAWVPVDWVIEDNLQNANRQDPDYDLCSLFRSGKEEEPKIHIRTTKPRNSDYYALCFDHVAILRSSIYALRQCARCRPIGREVLGKRFRVSDLARIYEYIFDKEIDVANLRRFFIKEKDNNTDNLLIVTNIKEESSTGRKPATLVEFNDELYDSLVESLNFRFPLFG